MQQQRVNKPRTVRKMRPSDYEEWEAQNDRDRARRARNRAHRTSEEAEAFLAWTGNVRTN